MALPKNYLADQPDLESHVTTFYERVENFQSRVIDRLRNLLNGSEQISDQSLNELEAHWIYDLKRLSHSKDEFKDKHLYRPIKVSKQKGIARNIRFVYVSDVQNKTHASYKECYVIKTRPD